MKRKIYEEAVADFLSSDSQNLSQCAKKFGLPPSTLYDLVTSDRGYQGKGSQSKVFTVEEEHEIAKTVLEKTDNGKELSWTMLKGMLQDEIEMIRLKTPSRNMTRVSSTSGSMTNMSFVRRFAERNGISQFLRRR